MNLQRKVKYRRGFKKWADEVAVNLRKELGLYPSSYLCAFQLCNYLGIAVFEPNEIKGMSKEQLNILLGEGNSQWSAATIPIGPEKYIIIHNPNHSPARQQSNLMHELAHVLCKHQTSLNGSELGLSMFLRNHDDDQENEAEWLGGCLQLPKPALIQSLKKEMPLDSIAKQYNSSIEMVKFRINVSGVKRIVESIKSKTILN